MFHRCGGNEIVFTKTLFSGHSRSVLYVTICKVTDHKTKSGFPMRKSALALLVATAGIAAILVSPADAKQRHQQLQAPLAQFNQLQLPGSAISPSDDPTGVYRDGRLIGRDPDPAIRAQILGSYGHAGAP